MCHVKALAHHSLSRPAHTYIHMQAPSNEHGYLSGSHTIDIGSHAGLAQVLDVAFHACMHAFMDLAISNKHLFEYA